LWTGGSSPNRPLDIFQRFNVVYHGHTIMVKPKCTARILLTLLLSVYVPRPGRNLPRSCEE
jgi:hypothetical protein